jgi:hypothetical protein
MTLAKKAILFITTASYFPLTDGKKQRTFFLIQALSSEYDIDVLYLGNHETKTVLEAQKANISNLYFLELATSKLLNLSIPNFLLSNKLKKARVDFLNEYTALLQNLLTKNKYAFVFSRYVSPLFAFPFQQNLKVVCDIDDVYFELQKTKMKQNKNLFQKIKKNIFYYLGSSKIIQLYKKIDVALVVKNEDKKYDSLKNAICIPNLPFAYYNNHNIKKNHNYSNAKLRIGFIGKLSYEANYEGLYLFLQNIWQHLMNENLSLEFVIAGSGNLPVKIQNIICNNSNIIFLGYVDEVEKFWNEIDVLVVPIEFGAGSNIKIAEGLMYGKKIIATKFAAKGFENFVEKRLIEIANNQFEWIKSIHNNIKNKGVDSFDEIQIEVQKTFNLQQWNTNLVNAMRLIEKFDTSI